MMEMFGKNKVYKIKRREGTLSRTIWVLSLTGAAVASVVVAWIWQDYGSVYASLGTSGTATLGTSVSEAPDSVSNVQAALTVGASAAVSRPTPIVVGKPKQAVTEAVPKEISREIKDFSVPYQAVVSDPVENSYFDDVLFVGDSITTGISIYQTMSNTTVVAATGVNPSTILQKPVIRDVQGELHTILETMAGYDPGKIYILLGANGIAWIEQEAFIAHYTLLINTIRKQHPDAVLYVQSIFPVTQGKSLGENGVYSNEKIDRYNLALMELCKEKGIAYVNVAEALKGPDGALPSQASTDGIHVGPEYYQKWFDYLKIHTQMEKE